MDFKKTFIDLTQWVVPHGYEETIVHLLPEGCQKDGKGNYFITIGESETLFTCHLDTVSSRAKITHVFEDNWIKTDGKTILGGDNKAGVCILMYLIEQNVPGTYYFFVGEECGRLGSKWALENDVDFFKKFKRAIAFDRRNRGSIITHQSSRLCASTEFTEALSKEMAKSGLEYKADANGSYTDTYTFIDVISECTNLSAAVAGEHTTSEKIDIVHCEEIAKAASLVDWENLPTTRDFVKKEWKSYGSYDSYDGGYYGGSYGSYNVKPKAETKKKSVSECGLEFNISNIDKFFNLKKVAEGEEIYYKAVDGKNYYINIDFNLVAIEQDFGHVYPYFTQHYVKKDNLPTTFEELWDAIKGLEISFKPIDEQKNIPFYQNNITEYFDLEEILDEHKNRLFIDPLTLREFQFEIDDKWIGIWEVLNREPYVSAIYANDNTFKSFPELWADIREYVPFRRFGKTENPFFNGGTKIKSYNNIEDKKNGVIAFTDENIDKYFDLVKVNVNKSAVDSYYKSPNGEKIYFIEISPNSKVFLWEKSSGLSSLIYDKQFFSFDGFWNEIKDKVEFKKREDDLDDILSQLEIPFRADNIEKFFTLKRRERDSSYVQLDKTKKSLFFSSENDKSYFFKIEDDGYVYMVDLSGHLNSKTQVIINYVEYKSFEKLWEDIKDKVDFKKIESKPKKSKPKKSSKMPFVNDNVCKFFKLKEYVPRSRHYVTEETEIQYYFDILDNNAVYLWERVNGRFNTIIDGAIYTSFESIWEDVNPHVKFKKREIPFTQDNVTSYFDLDLPDNKIRCFYYHKETDKNFFIYCGRGKNKSVVKLVKYKDIPETETKNGVRPVERMENLYFSGDDSIKSFDEFWEEIKDIVPFKKRGVN